MKNLTHETIGAAGALTVCAIAGTDVLTAAGCVAASVLGSRLPDACQLGSKIHRRTWWERRNPLVGLAGVILRLPLVLFGAIAKHRGATHWLSTAGVVAAVCGLLAAAVDGAIVLPVAAGVGAVRTARARRRVHPTRRAVARAVLAEEGPPAAQGPPHPDRQRSGDGGLPDGCVRCGPPLRDELGVAPNTPVAGRGRTDRWPMSAATRPALRREGSARRDGCRGGRGGFTHLNGAKRGWLWMLSR